MEIRFAENKDIGDINLLLAQVDLVHHNGRPDIFKIGNKYTDTQLEEIICDKMRPILCAVENDRVLGYAFCVFQNTDESVLLCKRKVLYIDDLCVDEKVRGKHIGEKLYRKALELAKKNNCDGVTLNVWEMNEGARKFYEKMGLVPLKTTMEQRI